MQDYKQLFEDYVGEMRGAQAVALAWWDELVADRMGSGVDQAQAEEWASRRWPMGAVSHPFVITTFRKWALQCQALNDAAAGNDDEDEDEEAIEAEDWGIDDPDDDDDDDVDLAELEAPVEPRELLVEMLPGRADDLAEFLADFVFTPLGLDKDDRWI